jgi:CHAT domain-containing protein
VAGRQRVSLPHGSTDINRAVQALRAELQRPGAGVPASAQALHRLLLAPLGGRLAGIHHLHMVPDGALRYVPFAALHDGRQYLVQRFSVSTELGRASEAQALPAQPLRQGHGRLTRLVAFGRTQGDERHSALPGVQQELALLGSLRGARVARALDAKFTAASLSQALATRPQVVHLASHFVLDAAGEEASYLLLGDGTRLPLRALRELPWAGVQLALLSACDSALALDGGGGAAGAQGKELSGFAATLHAAGVKHVMATLWRIDDAATAQWMEAFYAPWRQAAQPAGLRAVFTAQHLSQTQRQWLRRHAGTAQSHPYYWAAFSWLGQP